MSTWFVASSPLNFAGQVWQLHGCYPRDHLGVNENASTPPVTSAFYLPRAPSSVTLRARRLRPAPFTAPPNMSGNGGGVLCGRVLCGRVLCGVLRRCGGGSGVVGGSGDVDVGGAGGHGRAVQAQARQGAGGQEERL